MGVRNPFQTGSGKPAPPNPTRDRAEPVEGCPDDTTIHLLTTGCLAPEERDRVWAHVSRCDNCCDLLAHLDGITGHEVWSQHTAPQSQPLDLLDLEPGVMLGRYVLTQALGAGGMGEVWAAHDPELDRSVALKFLRSNGGAAYVHLLREAKAMARLSHPNVIAVHDVGTLSGHPFIAMERVHGCAVDKWLRLLPRTSSEVIRVYLEAGRGLAAAHAAGLVHRDFKPQNVLVDQAGHAKVTDFGVARVLDVPNQQTVDSQDGHAVEINDQSLQVGRLVGTLQYMSPEQLEGKAATPAADQFSYCVALWESLHGQKPFAGATREQLLTSILRGPPDRPDRSMPRTVHRALVRGLSPDPAHRHPSMEALLAALAPPRGLTRASWWLAVAALVAVAASLLGHWYLLDKAEPCSGAKRQMQEVWGEETATAVGNAFAATSSLHAGHTFKGVQQRLDAYANAWVEMHASACQATHVHGRQPEVLLLARMECLAQRKQELHALVTVLRNADANVVDHAIQAVESLRDLAGCANNQALLAQVHPPEDEGTRQRVNELRTELSTTRALFQAGRYKESMAELERLQRSVDALSFAPLQGELLALRGSNLIQLGEYNEAIRVLRQAAIILQKVRDDESAALVFRELAMAALKHNRYDQASVFTDGLEACTGRLGEQEDLLGLTKELRALVLHLQESDLLQALAYTQQSLEHLEHSRGPNHLWTANARSLLGVILGQLQKTDEAVTHQQGAADTVRAALGSTHPLVANHDNNLGRALTSAGRFQEALAAHQRALAVRLRAFGPQHPATVWSEVNVADNMAHLGQRAEALSRMEQLLPRARNAFRPGHTRVGYIHLVLNRILLEMGQPGKALTHGQEALTIWEQTDPATANIAEALVFLGNTYQALHQPDQALSHHERAAAIYLAKHRHAEVAMAHVGIAECLTTLHREPERALALARGARAALANASPIFSPYLQRAEQWLQLHAADASHNPSQ